MEAEKSRRPSKSGRLKKKWWPTKKVVAKKFEAKEMVGGNGG